VSRRADRRAAIELALRNARGGDIVVIAGKGHEDYQIVRDEKNPVRRSVRGGGGALEALSLEQVLEGPGRHRAWAGRLSRVHVGEHGHVDRSRPARCSSRLTGPNFDGHRFVAEAQQGGARGAVVQDPARRASTRASR
jgi:hypothetical protein